jgi:hypothetical protein
LKQREYTEASIKTGTTSKRPLYSSCFEIPEAAVNLQRRALGKRNNVKRLLKGEAYCPTGYGITTDQDQTTPQDGSIIGI